MAQDEWMVAIEAGRKAYLEVFKRARSCANPQCRRRRFCQAGWWPSIPPNPLYAPTGTCPVMTEAEWDVVQLGIIRNRQRLTAHYKWLDARDEAAGTLVPKAPGAPAAPPPKEAPPMGFAMMLFSEPTDEGYAWPKKYELDWRGWWERKVKAS